MSDPILEIKPLGFPWETSDPFLFCVYHKDDYPKGNDHLGPDASLTGRNIGQDFTIKDGWRMYHGERVPGFPQHPHRGFETITIVPKGLVDHSDSLGAAGRFGNGDVQWMTAGKGVLHSEMFPLLKKEEENHLLLFQIWLNLPKRSKFVPPHFSMLWNDAIPKFTTIDVHGKQITIDVIAGSINDRTPPVPPPDSWASDPANEVAIWTIKMEPGAIWEVPKASPGINKRLYFYDGERIEIAGKSVMPEHSITLRPDSSVFVNNGSKEGHLLLLQGKPIGEPIAQHGPFVMNTQQEIQEAMMDYQKTQFGGWPWPKNDHTHPREAGRFAKHADGREEFKDKND